MAQSIQTEGVTIVENVLERYRDLVARVGMILNTREPTGPGSVAHGGRPLAFVPPQEGGGWPEFYSAARVGICPPSTDGAAVLDMSQHVGTRTTKTIGSLMIVTRAIMHHQRTGERVALIAGSSGNKVTALRDAVHRAYKLSLADRSTLRFVAVVPASSSYKVREVVGSKDSGTPQLDPVLIRDCFPSDSVRTEVQNLVEERGPRIAALHGWRLWNTSDVANYAHGDCVRAFIEDEFMPSSEKARWHVHAVSSGFGLLGYDLGYSVLRKPRSPHGAFLLVQQLSAPALVVAVGQMRGERHLPPIYHALDGVPTQTSTKRFPLSADDPAETIDPTFYAKSPTTAAAVVQVIKTHGGDGIVVSRSECLSRYSKIRDCLGRAGLSLPLSSDDLREWSTVMAYTGLLLAGERGLLPTEAHALVHATGMYTDQMLGGAGPDDLVPVSSLAALAERAEELLST